MNPCTVIHGTLYCEHAITECYNYTELVLFSHLLSAFSSNTYRIFDEKIPEPLNPDEVYKDHKYASRDPEVTEVLKTHNIPQPHNVRFIRTNVRFLNEPIVLMETENTKDEQVPVVLDIRNNIP